MPEILGLGVIMYSFATNVYLTYVQSFSSGLGRGLGIEVFESYVTTGETLGLGSETEGQECNVSPL